MTIENASTVICPTENVEHLLHCIVCYMWAERTKLQTEIEPITGSDMSALHFACAMICSDGHHRQMPNYQSQVYNFARGYLALLNCQRQDARKMTQKVLEREEEARKRQQDSVKAKKGE